MLHSDRRDSDSARAYWRCDRAYARRSNEFRGNAQPSSVPDTRAPSGFMHPPVLSWRLRMVVTSTGIERASLPSLRPVPRGKTSREGALGPPRHGSRRSTTAIPGATPASSSRIETTSSWCWFARAAEACGLMPCSDRLGAKRSRAVWPTQRRGSAVGARRVIAVRGCTSDLPRHTAAE